MNPSDKITVGRTGLFITRLGMGCAALGGLYQAVSDSTSRVTVETALAAGIRYFDTAPLYGHGLSERRLGQALRPGPPGRPPNSFVISSKVGRLLVPAPSGSVKSDFFENPEPFEPVFDFSYDGVMRSFESSLQRLGLDRIDILFIHDPDDHPDEALQGAYPALEKLRRQRLVTAIGAGMNQTQMLARFAREADFDCFLLAGRYTLIDQSGLDELLPLCVEKKISVIVGAPFNSGILAGGAVSGGRFNYQDAPPEVVQKVARLERLSARYSIPLKAAALQFPLGHPAVSSVIPGMRSTAEVEENFRLMSISIPSDLWREMKVDGLLPEEAPVPA